LSLYGRFLPHLQIKGGKMMQIEQALSNVTHPVITGIHKQANKHTQQPLLHNCQGEILMVIEPDGISDVFCRNQYSGLTMLRHSALWCANVCKLNDARFYAGVMTPKGGQFHSISREQAIKHVSQWVFGKI